MGRQVLLAPFMMLFLFIGCSSSKDVKKQTTDNYAEQLGIISSKMDSLIVDINLKKKENNNKQSNVDIDTKTTLFSPPDSTGKQYPVAISETHIKKSEKVTKTSSTDYNKISKDITKNETLIHDSINYSFSEHEQVEKHPWWSSKQLYYCLSVICLIIICIIIYRHNKK